MNSILAISTVVLYIAFALANVADALTTIAGLRRGAVERNPLLGKKPTAAKIWAVKAAVIAIGAVAALPPRPAGAGDIAFFGICTVLLLAIAWRNHKTARG